MKTDFDITDMMLINLASNGHLLTVVSEHDPLLRRFGQVDVVNLDPAHPLTLQRKKADEVWTVLEGNALFTLVDRREDSPTFGGQVALTLEARKPQVVLVPFGIDCLIEAKKTSRLLRLTTHADDTDIQDVIPA
jgi:hypothetical protein